MSSTANEVVRDPYFRRDENKGISPPDLTKECSFAEYIVKARGKRTQYKSVSLDLQKIGIFGDTVYQLNRDKVDADGHTLVEHSPLLQELQKVAREESKEERLRAVQALRYARMRKEGLVCWHFDVSRIARKDVIALAQAKIQAYFVKV